MHTETIETPRLILRRLRAEDALPLHRNCSSDPNAARFLPRRPASDPEKTALLVEGWIKAYAQDDFFLWAIEFGGEVIGTVNLHDVSRETGCCEIGFSIGSRWWGRGIMTEAVRAIVRHAFGRLGLTCITGWCAAENAASARVMEKAGMRLERLTRQSVVLGDGSTADQKWYAVCRTDRNQEG